MQNKQQKVDQDQKLRQRQKLVFLVLQDAVIDKLSRFSIGVDISGFRTFLKFIYYLTLFQIQVLINCTGSFLQNPLTSRAWVAQYLRFGDLV